VPLPEPVGDYTQVKSLWISPKWVQWLLPGGLTLLFLVSFFPWVPGHNAWQLGFGEGGSALFVMYCLFLVLAWALAIPSLLLNLKVIPDLPPLRPIDRWRPVIVGGLAGVPFWLLVMKYLIVVFDPGYLVLSFWGLLGFWSHLIALLGAGLETWLSLRGPSKPIPRLDLHL
jgi:hypothetical protein